MLLCMRNGSTLRITTSTHRRLKALAKASGEPLTAILEKAVEAYRRQRLLEDANSAFAALRDDPAAWEHESKERRLWDATLRDGLEDD